MAEMYGLKIEMLKMEGERVFAVLMKGWYQKVVGKRDQWRCVGLINVPFCPKTACFRVLRPSSGCIGELSRQSRTDATRCYMLLSEEPRESRVLCSRSQASISHDCGMLLFR